jgi:hypothetical protein
LPSKTSTVLTVRKPEPPKPRFRCPCCSQQTSDMLNAYCVICTFTRKKDGSCSCGRKPSVPGVNIDMERLKALLRKSKIPIDKILEDDMRAFRKSLKVTTT